MAPKGRNGGDIDRFFCVRCKTWKGREHYSNKEYGKYDRLRSNATSVNGVSAQLRCRACAGANLHELDCDGPCERRRPLSDFSKNSRTSGSNWCKECTIWKQNTEADARDEIAPTSAPPEFDQAPDEWVAPSMITHLGAVDEEYSDDEEFDDAYGTTSIAKTSKKRNEEPALEFINGEIVPKSNISKISTTSSSMLHHVDAPYEGFGRMSIKETEAINARKAPQIPPFVPPHLRGQATQPTNSNQDPRVTGQERTFSWDNGEGDNDSAADEAKSVSTVSNAYEHSTSDATEAAWQPVGQRARVPFHAYGPNGQQALHYSSQPPSRPSTQTGSSRQTGISPFVFTRSGNAGRGKPSDQKGSKAQPQPAAPKRVAAYFSESEDEM